MSEHKEIPLKEYFDSKIEAVKEATKLAADSIEKRLAGMNEFRQALSEQAGRFITRSELDARLESIDKSKKDNTTLLIAVLAVIIGIASLFINR